ncbi:MAG: diversity-generating retroelement protein Avd [Candidatus Omnitrophica bacterium]|nr:diversity-generating retroelement protein Avd [Candidatus Omnitrophota bacterium]
MKVKDILQMELKNKNNIILLKEGMFFRAYNRSAMRLTNGIKTLKICVKWIKSVEQTIFYCGFPETIFSKIKEIAEAKNYQWQACSPQEIHITGLKVKDENYEMWTQEVLKRHEVSKAPNFKKKGTSSVTPVVEKHYDLMVWFMPKLAKFPKDQRYVMADRIGARLLDIQERLIEAVYTAERNDILRAVNIRIDQLRYLVRISKDMKYISVSQYDHFVMRIVEIGRMVGGWLRAQEHKARDSVFTDAGCGR